MLPNRFMNVAVCYNDHIFAELQRDGPSIFLFFFFLNEKVGGIFLYSLAIFSNQLISRLFGLLPSFLFLPHLQHILLAWPRSRLKSLKRKGLEIKEVITAKGLNKEGLDMASVVTGANRGK